jgi:hypothetical protein
MDFDQFTDGLARSTLVEVVYLAGRYLTHRLTMERFDRQLRADVSTEAHEQAAGIVRDIIRAIEAKEGVAIHDLPSEKRFEYVDLLSDKLWQGMDAIDEEQADAALESLRRTG